MTRASSAAIGISAVCSHDSSNWYKSNACLKGWGKSKLHNPSDVYSVDCAQGYAKNGVPIYSTVTKYRDAVYNYITTRVAKA